MPAAVAGTATSFDLPQYLATLLWLKGRRPNAFLKLIGDPTISTSGIRRVGSQQFPMGVDFTLDAPAQPAILQGAAPTNKEYPLEQEENVVQIFQRGVSVTYTRLGGIATINGVAVAPGEGNGELTPAEQLLDQQIQRQLANVQQDTNYSFLNGAYVKAANSGVAYKTRGLLSAIATNVFANGGTPRALTKAIVEAALQAMVANGAMQQGDTIFALAPAAEFSPLIDAYYVVNQQPTSFTVSGSAVNVIMSKWGRIVPIWEPDMPAGQIALVQPAFCRPAVMPIPGKGELFVEPMGKVGSKEEYQIYGELGLDYTSEYLHGLIKDLS